MEYYKKKVSATRTKEIVNNIDITFSKLYSDRYVTEDYYTGKSNLTFSIAV